MLRKICICLVVIMVGILSASPTIIIGWRYWRLSPRFPRIPVPIFGEIIYLPSSEYTGVLTGSNSADATAYNNGTHTVGVHYPTATEPYRYLYSCVYHSLEEEIYRGYVQFEGWSGTTQPWQIPEPNNGNIAFPAMAMVNSPEIEDGTAWVYGIIAYLTGEIKTDAWGGIEIARGEKLRVRAFKIDDATPGDWKDISLRDGYYAGAPSITYVGSDGQGNHYFVVTVVEYKEPFIGCWNYVDVFRVILTVGNPPTLTVDDEPFVVMRDWHDEDEVNVVYYTPSTAVYGEFPPGAMSGGKYCNLTYLHTVWGWKNGVFGIGYNVAEWSSLNQTELTAFNTEKLEPIKEGAHSNPHINRYGQNLLVNWTRNMGYPRLEIMRRRRNAEMASGDPTDLIKYWDPPIYEEGHEGEPFFYIPPCTLSTWSQHNSENLVSDFPQGSAFSTVWTEQRGSSSNTEIYLHDRNPWFWGPDGVGFSVSQAIEPSTMGPDFFPQVALTVRYTPSPYDYLHREVYIVWTSQNPEPPPSYLIERVVVRFNPSASSMSLSSSNRGDTLKIDPLAPVYYDIVCGESLPSLYCEKRDSIIVTGEHKVDTGEELIYNLPHLKPSLHYLIAVKVWAPESTKEVFTLDGVETDTILLDPTKSQNLACFIPESLYMDRFVELRINGLHGAYLENLKLYQIDIMDKSDKPSPGIISFSSSPKLALSINPTLGFPVKIKYQTSGKGLLTLRIYDATGRLMKVLRRTYCLQPTAYTMTWKGDDDKGKPLPSGIYFVRLKFGSSILTRKVVMIR